jgi:hypothetical protein
MASRGSALRAASRGIARSGASHHCARFGTSHHCAQFGASQHRAQFGASHHSAPSGASQDTGRSAHRTTSSDLSRCAAWRGMAPPDPASRAIAPWRIMGRAARRRAPATAQEETP